MRDDIRAEYDYYVEKNNRHVLNKAGIATAIGVSIISLVTGLVLGLKRTSKDIEASAKTNKWSLLTQGQ